ncbi:hypothetical protein ACFVTY_03475 [Streptomyces sp. NPDC058067]
MASVIIARHALLPGQFMEQGARELAAALHAALYGDLEPLTRAVPQTP